MGQISLTSLSIAAPKPEDWFPDATRRAECARLAGIPDRWTRTPSAATPLAYLNSNDTTQPTGDKSTSDSAPTEA